MDGTCLAAGTVAGEGSTGRGGGTGAEDLAEVGCFAKVLYTIGADFSFLNKGKQVHTHMLVSWPANSLKLSSLDFNLWGHLSIGLFCRHS